MGVTAILFPGQGSQTPEMRETVAEVRPDLLALAEEIVGADPFARVEEGTRFAQPAIFCASLAGWESLGRPTGDFMAGAVPEFTAALEQVEVSSPRGVTVLSAVTAAPFENVREQLAQALTSPVRWRETLLAMRELGAEQFVEVGPGRVLTGLVKRTLRDVELVNA